MNYKINLATHNYTFTKMNVGICLYVSIFYKFISLLLILLIYIFIYIYVNYLAFIDM